MLGKVPKCEEMFVAMKTTTNDYFYLILRNDQSRNSLSVCRCEKNLLQAFELKSSQHANEKTTQYILP